MAEYQGQGNFLYRRRRVLEFYPTLFFDMYFVNALALSAPTLEQTTNTQTSSSNTAAARESTFCANANDCDCVNCESVAELRTITHQWHELNLGLRLQIMYTQNKRMGYSPYNAHTPYNESSNAELPDTSTKTLQR